jgi:polyisoprenoid-binding protein YceI
MRYLRNSIAVTLLVVAILALFGLAVGTSTTSAAIRAADVTYSPIASGRYDLDINHGIIGFGVRHLGIALVEGRFKDFRGVVTYDDKDVTKSSAEFSAKIASVDTGVAPRDAHLRSADFFDAEKFPEMTFRSTKIEKKDVSYLLTGDLTIKGVTKQITFPFKLTGAIADPWGGTRFGIEGSTVLNRRDFGINFGSLLPSGALDVANEVNVELHIEAVKAK